jgi:hypothetical protein
MEGGGRDRNGGEEGKSPDRRPAAIYSILVGLVFIAVIAVAAVNLISTEESGVLGAADEGDLPLAQFAVPDARQEAEGDANIAQDDCETPQIPCPEGDRRTPACEVDVSGAIRVCDLFGKPLVLSFWFTKGGDCEAEQDVFETVYRRFGDRVNFLAIDVRDEPDEVRRLISERHWTHPVGLDRDGALSNLYRVGGCPSFVYAYPGGILQGTSIGELTEAELTKRVNELVAASRKREELLR